MPLFKHLNIGGLNLRIIHLKDSNHEALEHYKFSSKSKSVVCTMQDGSIFFTRAHICLET